MIASFAQTEKLRETESKILELKIKVAEIDEQLKDPARKAGKLDWEYSQWRKRASSKRHHLEQERSFLSSCLKEYNRSQHSEFREHDNRRIKLLAERRAELIETADEIKRTIKEEGLDCMMDLVIRLYAMAVIHDRRGDWRFTEKDRSLIEEVTRFLEKTGRSIP